jgi:ferrous iron transport protein A
MKSDFNNPEPASVSLAELIPGQIGRVAEMPADNPVGRRLMDLGVLPGTPIRALRRSPLGDPSVYELRGYRLCLRKADAGTVRVTSDKITP